VSPHNQLQADTISAAPSGVRRYRVRLREHSTQNLAVSSEGFTESADPRDPMPASKVTAASRGKSSRVIPAAVRREVWRRDSGRCCYVDVGGRRCRETNNIEFHHKTPFALGGLPTTENIELRCRAHNQFQADLDFGRSFMNAKRSKIAAA
jgi:5-methylcytosine-specific restriction endonuclease McrA